MINTMTHKKSVLSAVIGAVVFLLAGCGGSGNVDNNTKAGLELKIAHINDTHSNIRPPDTQTLLIDGQTYYAEQGGFGRMVSLFNSLSGTPNLLKLHSGDAITGTYFYNLFKGETDALAMNDICFDAYLPGNHDFDYSDSGLKQFLDFLSKSNSSCKTAIIAANIHPATGTPLAARSDGTAYLQPYIVRNFDGVRVGIIGIDVKGKTVSGSKPLPTTIFDNETDAAQRTIDILKADGINHIVLMTHIGYENDLTLASKLTDVDVIIGGDSHSFLGTYSPVLRKTPEGNYPTIVTNKSGDKVCIGQAWEYTKVFARMNVKFKTDGTINACSGEASIVIGQQLYTDRNKTKPLSAPENALILSKLGNHPEIVVSTEEASFKTQMASYEAKYDEETKAPIGMLRADQSLCLIRVPGIPFGPQESVCSDIDMNARGSDIAQIVAEAYRKATETASKPAHADFSLVNVGSVRMPINTDGVNNKTIIRVDAFNVQPYFAELIVVKITGSQIKTALEQGVANWLNNGLSTGSHPYASGLRWDLDLSQSSGNRFSNLKIKD